MAPIKSLHTNHSPVSMHAKLHISVALPLCCSYHITLRQFLDINPNKSILRFLG